MKSRLSDQVKELFRRHRPFGDPVEHELLLAVNLENFKVRYASIRIRKFGRIRKSVGVPSGIGHEMQLILKKVHTKL